MRDTVAALAVAILFLVFLAYEIAGSSSLFPDLHTVSWYAQRHSWLRIPLFALPPALYQAWWLWHMARPVLK